jgi:hypothetical protein
MVDKLDNDRRGAGGEKIQRPREGRKAAAEKEAAGARLVVRPPSCGATGGPEDSAKVDVLRHALLLTNRPFRNGTESPVSANVTVGAARAAPKAAHGRAIDNF